MGLVSCRTDVVKDRAVDGGWRDEVGQQKNDKIEFHRNLYKLIENIAYVEGAHKY